MLLERTLAHLARLGSSDGLLRQLRADAASAIRSIPEIASEEIALLLSLDAEFLADVVARLGASLGKSPSSRAALLRHLFAKTGLVDQRPIYTFATLLEGSQVRRALLEDPVDTVASLPGLQPGEVQALQRLGPHGLRLLTGALSPAPYGLSTIDTMVGWMSPDDTPGLRNVVRVPGGLNPGELVPFGEVQLKQPWSQVDSLAIPQGTDLENVNGPWQAGRVTDVLVSSSDGKMYVSSDAGIWIVDVEFPAAPVPDAIGFAPSGFNCMVEDPGVPGRIFAAGSSLVVNDPSWHALPIPSQIGSIAWVDITLQSRFIVLATDVGIFWAPLPASTEKGPFPGTLKWQSAIGFTNSCTTIVAFDDSIVVGDTVGVVYRGVWARPRKSPKFFEALYLTEVAAPTASLTDSNGYTNEAFVGRDDFRKDVAYAIGRFGYGLMTTDAGQNWTPLPSPIPDTGRSRPCRVAGYDTELIMIGAVTPWLSTDSGKTWTNLELKDNPGSLLKHLHDDVNTIRFRRYRNAEVLLIGTDGGLASTPVLGGNYQFFSNYNRKLLNLETHAPGGSYVYAGSLGVSPKSSGIVVAGTQDNGVQYIDLSPSGTGAWTAISDGDGLFAIVLGTNQAVWNSNDNNLPHYASATASPVINGQGQVPVDPAITGMSNLLGITMDVLPIPGPWFSDSREVMWGVVSGTPAAAGNPPSPLGPPLVFGLFAAADGTGLHLSVIGSMYGAEAGGPSGIRSVFSCNAQATFVGDNAGNIYRFDGGGQNGGAPAIPVLETVVNVPKVRGLVPIRFTATSDGTFFAAYATGAEGQPNYLLRREPYGQWRPVDNGIFFALGAAVRSLCADDGHTVFVSTTAGIYAWDNQAQTWSTASTGLPAWPQCSDIRFVRDPDTGAPFLYLATFGRGLWRAVLPN